MNLNLSKWMICLLLVSLISVAGFSGSAGAEVPYVTFFKDSYGRVIPTQPVYTPASALARDIYVDDGNGGKVYSPLKRPQDLFIDRNDRIYIADTDNNRIVELYPNGDFMRELIVPDSPLKSPQGVFVSESGDIYVADTGNKRVVKLDRNGRLLQQFSRPQSRLINDSFVYEPTNMVVDSRGFVYVVSKGSYQGIVQFDASGKFFGFFGTNATDVSFMDIVRKRLYTKEQLSRKVRLLPTTIRNIDIDRNGFINTVSGSSSEQVKKLNIRSENVWKNKNFGEKLVFSGEDRKKDVQLTDISVDANGNMTVIDKNLNIVSQYDANGDLQFFWKGPPAASAAVLGLNRSPVAIATNSRNELFILDDDLNLVQKLQPNDLGTAVHQAYLYAQEGKYGESEKSWEKVIKLNALYSPAYYGMAQAYNYAGDYKRANELYKLAGDAQGYSDTFWQLRLQWFQKYFSLIANTVAVLAVLLFIALKLKRKSNISLRSRIHWKWLKQPLVKQLSHGFYILKHPLDGFSDLRYLNRGSYTSGFILLVGSMLILLVKTYFTGFVFSPVPLADIHGSYMVMEFLVLWTSWVVCNYLIGSIYQGEARFKDVVVGSAYSLFPIVLLGIPLALISNVLTLSEGSIYHSVESAMFIWSALLFFWNIQALQNYSFGETIVNIFLTVVAMIILWVFIFVVFGLSSELFNFMYTIYQEVSK